MAGARGMSFAAGCAFGLGVAVALNVVVAALLGGVEGAERSGEAGRLAGGVTVHRCSPANRRVASVIRGSCSANSFFNTP